jgi:hypothetical protein
MKCSIVVLLFLASCSREGTVPKEELFSRNVSDPEWTTYEGKWKTEKGTLKIELSLKNNSNNVDAFYNLWETNESPDGASGITSKGGFMSYNLPDHESGIRLLELKRSPYASPLRVKESSLMDLSEEMYFVTRGANELIPTDKNFVPITEDPMSTLHKALNYFTVEGYLTIEGDSVQYFEKNTRQYWKVSHLGEFEKARGLYETHTKEKYEGLYLRGLAYSIYDSTMKNQQALVIKTIKAAGITHDTEEYY